MAARIGIRELRDKLTATVRRVRVGEAMEVTHDGVPAALLAPRPEDRIGRLVARGDVSPPRAAERLVSRHPVLDGVSATQALEDDRAERCSDRPHRTRRPPAGRVVNVLSARRPTTYT